VWGAAAPAPHPSACRHRRGLGELHATAVLYATVLDLGDGERDLWVVFDVIGTEIGLVIYAFRKSGQLPPDED